MQRPWFGNAIYTHEFFNKLKMQPNLHGEIVHSKQAAAAQFEQFTKREGVWKIVNLCTFNAAN